MFSRFTEKAIQAIMLAQEEAKKFHHSYVGTEHILLGIIGEGDNVVIKTLQIMGFSSEQIKTSIEERLEFGGLTSDYGNIPFTQQAKQVLTHAWDEARKLGHNYVNVEHLFLSIFREPTNIAARVLTETGIDINQFKDTLFTQLGNRLTGKQQKIKQSIPTPTLDLFGRDLTWLAQEGKLDPVIGREKEIERMIQILCRRSKNNPVLTGEPGVGKTAIVEGLASKIIKSDIPEKLAEKRLITLDLGLLVAGTKYRGEFEDRVKKVMEEVRKAKNIILFVDELHTIIGTGGSEGSLDAANLFKPALARGELQCIGATTLDEYRKHIEGDGALERRFQSILVEEPPKEDTVKILEGIKSRYEEFHNVTITSDALVAAVELSTRYITDRQLPDKAVDLIDEAASKVMLKSASLPEEIKHLVEEKKQIETEQTAAKEGDNTLAINGLQVKLDDVSSKIATFSDYKIQYINQVVDEHIIADVVANWTGVPVTQLSEEDSNRLKKMNGELKTHIIGQDEAIKSLVRAVKRAKMGLKDPKRPMGSFLFLGPTGVGKSELAKQLAVFLFGQEDALIRIDMSEYMEKHTVSKLIGSPPGYVGFNEGGQLTEPIRRKPYSVVLFDELEKASPDVINILLQILDDGRLTDSSGRTVNFKNTIIIMTSNVGSKFIESETSFGFHKSGDEGHQNYVGMKSKLTDELRREFKPEFLNRIDDTVIFKALDKDDLKLIIDVMLRDLQNRLNEKNISITVDQDVKDYLVEKGIDKKHGARPLRRAIQEYFEDVLVDKMLEKNHRNNISAKASIKSDTVSFTITPKRKPSPKKIKEKTLSLPTASAT